MDYDRYDATLHYIFKQTQGDAWFRPHEDQVPPGVCLRTHDVRSAAVHAALAEQAIDDCIYVDANTRIQVLDSMCLLPQAEKDQNAAFIRDERVLVVWSDSLDTIIPIARDFEDRLIRLLWRTRPPLPSTHEPSIYSEKPADPRLTPSSTVNSESPKRTWYGRVVPSDQDPEKVQQKPAARPIMLYAPVYNGLSAALAFIFIGNGLRTVLTEFRLDANYTHFALCAVMPLLFCVSLFFTLQILQNVTFAVGPIAHYHQNSRYYSAIPPIPNPAVDNALPHITIQMPVYKESLATVLTPSLTSLKTAMQTYARHGGTSSLFINDDGLRLLPPDQAKERIEYYATHGIGWIARPRHGHEGFTRAGRFKKASNMNYALDVSLRLERILEELQSPHSSFNGYNFSHSGAPFAQNNPNQNQSTDSNLLRPPTRLSPRKRSIVSVPGQSPGTYGVQYIGRDGDDQGFVAPFLGGGGTPRPGMTPRTASPEPPTLAGTHIEDLEERALQLAMEEVFQTSQTGHRPWAANSRACRIGSIILLVDADTVVPADCFRDAAREFGEDDDVLQVAHHYFENAIAFFTRRINKCISMMCANGEVAPFVGHNAFLRWSALQDAAFGGGDVNASSSSTPAPNPSANPNAGATRTPVRIWSEDNVSEDFDMALRLLRQGYIVRWATYSKGGFKEGVSLTVDDELNRWQKYAYGCNELLFNPFAKWLFKGPINHQIHKFIWSPAPLHYKISMMAYGIAASATISLINYIMLGFQFPTDDFYMHSFEIWLATFVVFFGAGNVGYVLLQYRLGERGIVGGAIECFGWIPFL
ncbi:glycosyl transferase family group 2-domain-containing protein [Suillus lakei]|nr:glycosyl transferase family group 2-domain-containing protein [Suillus lakei]